MGDVIAASIFMASIDATLCPAVISAPGSTWSVTTPENGAATWPGCEASAFSAALRLDDDAAIAHEHRTQLAVEDGHDGAHALVVGLADRLEAGVQANALVDLDDVLGALAEAVQVVGGVD